MHKKLFLFLIIFSLVGFTFITLSCDKKADDTTTQADGDGTEEIIVAEPVKAVCIYDGELRFRKEPEYESGISGTLRKGEKITFLGRIEEGPGYRGNWEYYLIQRSDGTEGWAWGDYIIPDAAPAVIVTKTTTYDQNNDVQINMDFSLEPMTIIAIVEDKGSWLKVAYKNKDKLVWIKPGTLSYADIDISVANLVKDALDSYDKVTGLESILEIDAFRDSIFINNIHETLFELQNPEEPEMTGSAGEGEVTLTPDESETTDTPPADNAQ